MNKKKWRDLSPRLRTVILLGAAVEGALKIAALVDLSRRPAAQVRGPKWRWVVAVLLVNTGGGAPLAYFRRGRLR